MRKSDSPHILRGFAFTKPDGLVVDMFHFDDEERFPEVNPGDEGRRAIDVFHLTRQGANPSSNRKSSQICTAFWRDGHETD